MRVRVQRFRREGKRLTDLEITNNPEFFGELSTHRMKTPMGGYMAAEVAEVKSGGLRTVLAVLYEPAFIQILGDTCLLRGLEVLPNRQTVIQEWLCHFMPDS